MRSTTRNFVCILLIFSLSKSVAQAVIEPNWIQDLVIYEIATKNFTSTEGAGTGTFVSTQAKVSYLAELGITGVWLSGHNWADSKHFYGIWTQYATIRPDSIDSSLGTREELKELIIEFHKHDIKVFLDIITHGVMNYSPLITQHPEWFKGSSWGMIDYDWSGNHQELDDWWIKTHVDYVKDLGIDGYRLDVDIYRPDLWKEIKSKCTKIGHPIAIFLEWYRPNSHVCDFYQHNLWLKEQPVKMDTALKLVTNVAQAYTENTQGKFNYKAQFTYSDESVDIGSSLHGGKLNIVVKNQPERNRLTDSTSLSYMKNQIKLHISNLDTSKYIKNILIVSDPWTPSIQWNINTGDQETAMKVGNKIDFSLKPFLPQSGYLSVQLSCHDAGWQGFPENQNPYMAEGSRCLMGYNCLLTPAIPIFYSGEEFNANFIANPSLTPELFGKGVAGSGKWLYGSVIDWKLQKSKKHTEMLNDTKKLLAIRKSEKDLLKSYKYDSIPDIFELEFTSNGNIPAPYAIQNNEKIIIIAGNSFQQNVKCTIKLPLSKTNISSFKTYKVFDLWNDKTFILTGSELENFTFNINADNTKKGGVAVFKIEK